MIKNKFIKSTVILLIGGFVSKLMAMVIRIVLSRKIGTEGLGLYMMVLPTFGLFITLSNLGLPLAVSKLVSEGGKNNKKLVLSLVPLILIFNIFLMIVIILISPFISRVLLKNDLLLYPIMAIGLTLPFITISDILRGYFFGKERMWPYTISNNGEQLIRLLLVIFLIPYLLRFSVEKAVTGVVLINIISEGISIIILLLFTPRVSISKDDFMYNKYITKEALSIGIPSTSSRLIGTIGSFLEPVIITFVLLKVGYQTNYITMEYGIINGYVLPLLLLPSFFSYAISNALLPVISNAYANGHKKRAKTKLNQAIFISLLIGIPISLIFIFIPQIPLSIIYKTNLGINYIKVIAPFFLMHYIQAPLTSTLQAMGKSKCAMWGTLIGTILRSVILFVISLFKVGMWGLIMAIISNIVFTTLHHLYYVYKYLKD